MYSLVVAPPYQSSIHFIDSDLLLLLPVAFSVSFSLPVSPLSLSLSLSLCSSLSISLSLTHSLSLSVSLYLSLVRLATFAGRVLCDTYKAAKEFLRETTYSLTHLSQAQLGTERKEVCLSELVCVRESE